MSALASLVRAYDRLAGQQLVPTFGYSQEKVGFLIPLNPDGTVAHIPVDLRSGDGKRKSPRTMAVPQALKRTSGVASNFLWDKTAYALGVTAHDSKRTAIEHRNFVQMHKERLADTEDDALRAFLLFLDSWAPEQFDGFGWPSEMKDQNVVFALESERRRGVCLHDRPAARALWARYSSSTGDNEAVCLLTGEVGQIARLHPTIKGVWGAQSSGASVVSFNLKAFESYGHEQGLNAPVSEAAAFAYTTALNHFLVRENGHRIQIGDASTVFWADASGAQTADEAEAIFGSLIDEKIESGKVGDILQKLREGRSIENIKADLPQGVRFFVLGLAPNAARISVRFYLEDEFGVIMERYLRHLDRLRIEPAPRGDAPSMWRLLVETAVRQKSDNILPNLAGDWMRAILTGAPYPLTLLSALIMRIRADHDVNALRAAMLKSILIANFRMEVPVSLDPSCTEPGYLLGRLFAVYEQIQSAALGRNVNASIRDKFYGAASAQPGKVFPMLQAGSVNHLSKVGKQRPGLRVNLEKDLAGIMEAMSPGANPFPVSLQDRSQAMFGLGYYHQRSTFLRKVEKTEEETSV